MRKGGCQREWDGRLEAEYCEMLSAPAATLSYKRKIANKPYTKVAEKTQCILPLPNLPI